jgi:PPP family 3-phenylpropionic acid transporter
VELIRIAAAGCVLSALGLLGVQAAVLVSTMTVLLFMANGAVMPLVESTLAHLLNTSRGVDPQRYGRVRMWGSVGYITSVVLCGLLLDAIGIHAFPWLVALLNVLLLAAALRLPSQHEEAHGSEAAPPVLSRLLDPPVAWFFASIFFTVLAHTSLYTFFSLFLVELGYGKWAVGALWAVAISVEVLFFWQQGRWFERLSAVRWLQLAALLTAARMATIAAFGAWPMALVLAQLSHAVTFAAQHAACINLVHRYFPGRLRGRGQALYTVIGYGASGVLGGVGGGWLIGRLGFAAVFWGATAAGLLALGCASRIERAPKAA